MGRGFSKIAVLKTVFLRHGFFRHQSMKIPSFRVGLPYFPERLLPFEIDERGACPYGSGPTPSAKRYLRDQSEHLPVDPVFRQAATIVKS